MWKKNVIGARQGKGRGRMSQDEWYLANLWNISNFSYVQWENPSLLNPYDIISDVIDDITSTPNSYLSRSTEFYNIQHG